VQASSETLRGNTVPPQGARGDVVGGSNPPWPTINSTTTHRLQIPS
jgi:hypothetical protein